MPIGWNRHWSLVTADLRTQTICHDKSLWGTNGTPENIGATSLWDLLKDVAIKLEIDKEIDKWTSHNSSTLTMPQQKGNINCGVFVCAYATLRQQDLESELFDQSHNQRMRLYIANVSLANETLPLTQVHLKATDYRNRRTRSTSKYAGYTWWKETKAQRYRRENCIKTMTGWGSGDQGKEAEKTENKRD